MRDKYNLNTLPPSLAGLEDYEMDEHVSIPGMGMTEDRLESGEPQLSLSDPPPSIVAGKLNTATDPAAAINKNAAIPGLDLDLSTVRDKKLPYTKPKVAQSHWPVENKNDELFYGTTAHDPASILKVVRNIVESLVKQLPGTIPLEELKPEKIQIYGKDIEVKRKFRNIQSNKYFK